MILIGLTVAFSIYPMSTFVPGSLLSTHDFGFCLSAWVAHSIGASFLESCSGILGIYILSSVVGGLATALAFLFYLNHKAKGLV